MGILNKIMDFESQPLSSIIYVMVKWFQFDRVQQDIKVRSDVESGVWINLKIEQQGREWHISGQTNEIVKRRLIEFLDEQKVRSN